MADRRRRRRPPISCHGTKSPPVSARNVGAWSFTAGAARNLQTGMFDDANFNIGWQNNCFGINLLYYQYFTSYYSQGNGGTTALVQFTFKTLGTIGMNAL